MKRIAILWLVLPFGCFAQNWEVFNQSYRYNYRYNKSATVTNVLFADSVTASGTDTICHLNRIGVRCISPCFGIIASPGSTIVVPGQPQFLQRKVIKMSNGQVILSDTAEMILRPFCQPGESWLFDSIAGVTASCVSLAPAITFGNADSVKKITLDNSDTIVLSRSFGILMFPHVYGFNSYYRLTGIEKRSSYEKLPFHGEKVPNAWDFYNFQPGTTMCRQNSAIVVYKEYDYCMREQASIDSRAVTATGYRYHANFYSSGDWLKGNCDANGSYYSGLILREGLDDPLLVENKMYPGMILKGIPGTNFVPGAAASSHALVYFTHDNTGVFYKAAGIAPCWNSSATLDVSPGIASLKQENGYYSLLPPYTSLRALFGAGFGQVSGFRSGFEFYASTCLTCFRANGIDYFGQPYVGVSETADPRLALVYPNPVSGVMTVFFPSRGHVTLLAITGETILYSPFEGAVSFNVTALPEGTYVLRVLTSGAVQTQKVIVLR